MPKLNDVLADKPMPERKGTTYTVQMIHYSKLIPNPENAYSLNGLKELANMILLSGEIKEPLLVRKKAPEEYEIISGHRRRLATKILVEEMGLEKFAYVPVHLEKTDDIMSRINLYVANAGQRDKSDYDRMIEVRGLTDALRLLQNGSEEEKELFYKVCGSSEVMGERELRKVVASKLGLSETKVANLKHIDSKLEPELMEKFEKNKIGISAANEAASLPPEKQKELAKKENLSIREVQKEKEPEPGKGVSESDTEKSVSESDTESIPGQKTIYEFPEHLPDFIKEPVNPVGDAGVEEIPGQQEKWQETPVQELETVKENESRGKWQQEPQKETEQKYKKPGEKERVYLNAFAKKFIECNYNWFSANIKIRVQDVIRSPEEIKTMLGTEHRTWNFNVNEKQAHINLFDEYVQLWDKTEYLGKFDWFYLSAAIQAMWNTAAFKIDKKKQAADILKELSELAEYLHGNEIRILHQFLMNCKERKQEEDDES